MTHDRWKEIFDRGSTFKFVRYILNYTLYLIALHEEYYIIFYIQSITCKKSTERHTLKQNIYVTYSYGNKNENIKFSKKTFPQSRNIGKRNNLKLFWSKKKNPKCVSRISKIGYYVDCVCTKMYFSYHWCCKS